MGEKEEEEEELELEWKALNGELEGMENFKSIFFPFFCSK